MSESDSKPWLRDRHWLTDDQAQHLTGRIVTIQAHSYSGKIVIDKRWKLFNPAGNPCTVGFNLRFVQCSDFDFIDCKPAQMCGKPDYFTTIDAFPECRKNRAVFDRVHLKMTFRAPPGAPNGLSLAQRWLTSQVTVKYAEQTASVMIYKWPCSDCWTRAMLNRHTPTKFTPGGIRREAMRRALEYNENQAQYLRDIPLSNANNGPQIQMNNSGQNSDEKYERKAFSVPPPAYYSNTPSPQRFAKYIYPRYNVLN